MSTVSLDIEDNLLQQAKVHVAVKGVNLTQLVNEYLTELTKIPDLSAKRAILRRYSKDELSRKETMALLNVDYGELISIMADNHLPLPSLSEAEIKAMAAMFAKIWKGS